ncbi:MAG TPA: hypothetical protein VFU31_21125 [Candidatus Binatia bacterium]|nr:hypothetical protein [Candidatus Binatia bacterium]
MSNTTKLVDELAKKLADDGKLIEAGFAALRLTVIPADASAIQVREMRMAFMAGAQHLFSSIISVLDPGSEPTDADLRRMNLINAELEAFVQEMKLRVAPKG